MRTIGKTLLVAVALSSAAVSPAWCGASPQPLPPPPPAHNPVGPGPWVLGGTIVAALSLMICAEWECATSNREMTPEEAITAAGIPFSCFWWRRYHNQHGPVCSGPHRP